MPALHKVTATEMAAVLDEIERLGTQLWKRKPTDQIVNNSSALVNDSSLFLSLLAGKDYRVGALIFHISGTVPDIQMQWTLSGGGGMVSGGQGQVGTYQNQYNTGGITVYDGIASNMVTVFDGTLVTAAAGTLQLKWAQITPTVSDTKVLANSHVWAEQMT